MKNAIRTVVAWAALVAALCAQDISKTEVFLEAGKSDKVTIAVPGCQPDWTVTIDEPGFSVTPTSVTGKEKATFTIRADKDVFSAQTTITVNIVDESCLAKPINVELRAYAVMDDKGAEKSFKKSIKARQKTLKNELKAARKEFDTTVKEVLAGVKNGELPEDGSVETLPYQAFLIVMFAMFTAYRQMFGAYRNYLGGCASDGRSALSLYGFIPLLFSIAPLAFLTGGCGTWDDARLGGFGLLLSALVGMFGAMKSFQKKLAKLTSVALVMTIMPFIMVDFSAAIPDPTSASAGSTDGLDEGVRIVTAAAINSTAATGVDAGATTEFTSNSSRGRIVAMGRAPAGADVSVTAAKAVTSDGIGAFVEVTADGDGFWYAVLPDSGSTLPPGTYQIIATSDGDTDVAAVAVRNALD